MKSKLASLVLYLAAVTWLTWPLAAHLPTHLPATRATWLFDGLYGVWALAWESHALATEPRAFTNGNIFHPTHPTLFYGPATFGALPYFAPVFLTTANPVLAMNLAFLAGIALTAWTLHLVVHRWTASHLAGGVAAFTWLTTPYVLWSWVPTVPYHAILMYFPLVILRARAPLLRARQTLALAALVALQSLTDLAYVAPAVFAPLGLLALARLARRDTRAAGLRLVAALALAALALGPALAGYAAVRAANPNLAQQTFWPLPPSPTVIPCAFLGSSTATGVPIVALALIAIGWLTVAGDAASRGAVRGHWAHAALWVLAGVLISLTPVVVWREQAISLPPHLLAQSLGLYHLIRHPARLAIAALFGLCVLAGLAFAACARWLGTRGGHAARLGPLALAAAVGVALHLEYARGMPPWVGRRPAPPTYPLQLPPASSPRLAHAIAVHGGPLLQLPLGRDGIAALHHARAMFHSIAHWQPLLNGYSSYWPAGFRERMAIALRLPDPEAVAALRRKTGLRLILVNSRAQWGPQRRTWLLLAGSPRPDLRLLARDGDDLLFAVEDADPR